MLTCAKGWQNPSGPTALIVPAEPLRDAGGRPLLGGLGEGGRIRPTRHPLFALDPGEDGEVRGELAHGHGHPLARGHEVTLDEAEVDGREEKRPEFV